MKACILIKTEVGKHKEIKRKISKLNGVNFVFTCLGRVEVVANVEVSSLKELTNLVRNIGLTNGVFSSETLVSLEV